MSAATSPGTGLAYGLRRVCAAWGMARSSFYAMTSGQHAEQPPAKRRGPKPAISDQALLVAIEADLEASPWEGEGYRKVWARLRVCRDIRVARKRVLRLMRENNLLSPHRCRRRGGNPHDSEIITHAPNLMWGTDGVRVFTVDDGWGWIFTAVEHWNAECVGWHVCKRGDRCAALQPISRGLAGLYGSTAAGVRFGDDRLPPFGYGCQRVEPKPERRNLVEIVNQYGCVGILQSLQAPCKSISMATWGSLVSGETRASSISGLNPPSANGLPEQPYSIPRLSGLA